MRILISNDDGYGAPGIEALWEVAQALGEPAIVAPDSEQSGCGHQVTTHGPIRVDRVDATRFRVAGTPADCTRVGLRLLLERCDLVLAGINAGGNLGVDTFISGTVAAAREAVILGVPAIAVSQYRSRDRAVDWPRAARWARRIVEELVESGRSGRNGRAPTLWNVNLPCLPSDAPEPESVICELDPSPLHVRFRDHDGRDAAAHAQVVFDGDYHTRPRVAGGDVDVCLGGRIAVTELRL